MRVQVRVRVEMKVWVRVRCEGERWLRWTDAKGQTTVCVCVGRWV